MPEAHKTEPGSTIGCGADCWYARPGQVHFTDFRSMELPIRRTTSDAVTTEPAE